MNKTGALIWLTLSLINAACSSKVSEAELRDYIADPENGLVRTRQFDNLDLQLSFVPHVLFDQGGWQTNERQEEYTYFLLKISEKASRRSPIKSGPRAEKSEYLNSLFYVQTKIQNDFILRANGVVHPCVFLNYEDDHNIVPGMTLLLAFPKVEPNTDWIIAYEDHLFGLGLINFKVEKESLIRIPTLKS